VKLQNGGSWTTQEEDRRNEGKFTKLTRRRLLKTWRLKIQTNSSCFPFLYFTTYHLFIHSFIHKCTLDDSSFYLFYPITCICILFSISYLNTILYHHHVLTIVCVEYLVINPTGREGVWIRNILSDLHKLLCSNSHLSIYLYVYPVISFIPLGGSVKKCA
jgi:hypothetical protein